VRWSDFTVDYPDAGGETRLEDLADAFGCFTDAEREGCLLSAIGLVEERILRQ
jgi:hypothetical protein